MSFSALLRAPRALWTRWRADRIERAIFRELLAMQPHLLDDIGLSINDVASALDRRRSMLRHVERQAAVEEMRAASSDLLAAIRRS